MAYSQGWNYHSKERFDTLTQHFREENWKFCCLVHMNVSKSSWKLKSVAMAASVIYKLPPPY